MRSGAKSLRDINEYERHIKRTPQGESLKGGTCDRSSYKRRSSESTFVIGSLDEENDMTREEVQSVLNRQDGRR